MVASVASDGSTLVLCASCDAPSTCYNGQVAYLYPPGSDSWVGGHLASHLTQPDDEDPFSLPSWLFAELNGRGELLTYFGASGAYPYSAGNYGVLDVECAAESEGPFDDGHRTLFGCHPCFDT